MSSTRRSHLQPDHTPHVTVGSQTCVEVAPAVTEAQVFDGAGGAGGAEAATGGDEAVALVDAVVDDAAVAVAFSAALSATGSGVLASGATVFVHPRDSTTRSRGRTRTV